MAFTSSPLLSACFVRGARRQVGDQHGALDRFTPGDNLQGPGLVLVGFGPFGDFRGALPAGAAAFKADLHGAGF